MSKKDEEIKETTPEEVKKITAKAMLLVIKRGIEAVKDGSIKIKTPRDLESVVRFYLFLMGEDESRHNVKMHFEDLTDEDIKGDLVEILTKELKRGKKS